MAGRYRQITDSNEESYLLLENEAMESKSQEFILAPSAAIPRSLTHYEDCGEGLKTFQEVLKEQNISNKDIKVLITGRVGMGKSTLINSILELKKVVAKVGNTGDAVTTEVKKYSFRTTDGSDNTITLIDSPGLRHFSDRNNRGFYDNLFEDMMIEGENTNIVFYCRKMTDQRFEEDELITIRQLFHTFGPHFWERVVIVLTFANLETYDELSDDEDDSDDIDWEARAKERFTESLKQRSQELKNNLIVHIPMPPDVVDQIRVVPAGYYRIRKSCPKPWLLPDQKNWLKELLKQCGCDKEAKPLTSMSLRENLHLTVIIDDEGVDHATPDDDKIPTVPLNPPARKLKQDLEKQGQLVFVFNSLSIQSVSQLLEVIASTIKSSELAAFSLIILAKDNNYEEILINLEKPFKPLSKVPKIFFTHINSDDSKVSPVLPELPPNSIGFTVKSSKTSFAIEIFNQTIEASFVKPVTDCFGEMQARLEEKKLGVLHSETFDHNKSVFPPIYSPSTPKARLDFKKKKLDIQRVIWRKVRCQTCHELFDNKDEIRKLLRNNRIARIASSVAGVIGGGLVIGGIVAAPFTFGTSIALAIGGGAVGAAAGVGGITAFITKKIKANGHLKKAQEQVTLDQQLSMSVNANVLEFYEAVNSYIAEISIILAGAKVAGGVVGGVGRLGLAAALVAAEGVVEGGALALRAGGRIAGMALAGVSLAVTVPIDLGLIIYHSYMLYQESQDDKSGANNKDPFVTWFIQQIEGLLLDTITLYKCDHTVDADLDISDFGFHIQRTTPELAYNIRALSSGPFKLPAGATIVSAVYDVSIGEEMAGQPLEIDLDHCVDSNNQSTLLRRMSFAVGKLDYANRCYTFELMKGGSFTNKMGLISVEESCQICIVYNGRDTDSSPLTYGALCSYDRVHRNHWNLTIMFTKNLDAHLQFVKKEFPLHADDFKMHQFKFKPSCIGIPMKQFKEMSIRDQGWIIATSEDLPDNQTEISKKKLDMIEILSELSDSPVDKIPFVNLCVQVTDEANTVDEFRYSLPIEGTDLVLPIERKKEFRQPSS